MLKPLHLLKLLHLLLLQMAEQQNPSTSHILTMHYRYHIKIYQRKYVRMQILSSSESFSG